MIKYHSKLQLTALLFVHSTMTTTTYYDDLFLSLNDSSITLAHEEDSPPAIVVALADTFWDGNAAPNELACRRIPSAPPPSSHCYVPYHYFQLSQVPLRLYYCFLLYSFDHSQLHCPILTYVASETHVRGLRYPDLRVVLQPRSRGLGNDATVSDLFTTYLVFPKLLRGLLMSSNPALTCFLRIGRSR